MICQRPGCGHRLRDDQLRRGVRYHSKQCSSWGGRQTMAARRNSGPPPLVRGADEPDLAAPPAALRCYCGVAFLAGAGWGLFHDRACGERFIEARYFDLGDYQRRRHERAA